MARPPVVQTPTGHTAPVAPESPSTKSARHHAVIGKLHATVGAGPATRKALSPQARQNYDAVTQPRQSAKNAKLNAEMAASGTNSRASITPGQAAALKASGSRTY